MMRKRYAALAVLACAVMTVAGCGSESAEMSAYEEAESDVAAAAGADSEAEAYAPVTSVEEFKESLHTDRPSFTASDYVSLPEYIGIEVTEAAASETAEEHLMERYAEDFAGVGLTFSSEAEITDEEASLASGGRYADRSSYITAVRMLTENYSEYMAAENTFLNLLASIIDDVQFLGFPEEVLEYDLSNEEMTKFGIESGYTEQDMEKIIAEGEDSQKYMDLLERRESKLTTEILIRAMAEDLGIEEPDAYAYNVLMSRCGYYDYGRLLDDYSVDELLLEALTVDVETEVVSLADVQPLQIYNTTGLPGDEITVYGTGEVVGYVPEYETGSDGDSSNDDGMFGDVLEIGGTDVDTPDGEGNSADAGSFFGDIVEVADAG